MSGIVAGLGDVADSVCVVAPAVFDRWRVRGARTRLDARAARPLPPCDVSTPQRRLLVDVSSIRYRDAGTGVQRVVRAILNHLLAAPPPGFTLCLVAAGRGYAYRPVDWPELGVAAPADGAAPVRRGDVFLGLDLSAHLVPRHAGQLAAWKRQGMRFGFLLHDLLALHRPEWFSAKLAAAMRRWARQVAILADDVFCVSAPVEADFQSLLCRRYGLAPGSVATTVLPMGWDIDASRPSRGLPAGFDALLTRLAARPTVLMVGSVEPRKGYEQALDAFDRLWSAGHSLNLAVVGRPGWKTRAVQDRLSRHPRRGDGLVWLSDASDEALEALYRACDGVLVASLAEGFGLPVVEALGHGKPVLARDLPVFRSHGFAGVDFFTADDGEGLAAAILDWLDRPRTADPLRQETLPTWRDTTRAILDRLCAGREDETSGCRHV